MNATAGTTETTVLTHPWQEAGLGEAPFTAVAILSLPSPSLAEHNADAYGAACRDAGESAGAFGVHLGACSACGTALMNNVVIRDKNRRHFVVGCDCAARTGDGEVITQAEALERTRLRKIREEKAAAERRLHAAKVEAEHAAQRGRNGGLTDYELAAKAREEADAARAAAATAANSWLIDVLAGQSRSRGDFCDSIANSLRRSPLHDALSDRAAGIAADIYAKAHGRRNSKAHRAAHEAFYAKWDAEEAA